MCTDQEVEFSFAKRRGICGQVCVKDVHFLIEFNVLPNRTGDGLICELKVHHQSGITYRARGMMNADESLVCIISRLLPAVSHTLSGWCEQMDREIEITREKLQNFASQ